MIIIFIWLRDLTHFFGNFFNNFPDFSISLTFSLTSAVFSLSISHPESEKHFYSLLNAECCSARKKYWFSSKKSVRRAEEREREEEWNDKHHANPIFILYLAPAETLLFSPSFHTHTHTLCFSIIIKKQTSERERENHAFIIIRRDRKSVV